MTAPHKLRVCLHQQLPGTENWLVCKLLAEASGRELCFVSYEKCDLLLVGPYNGEGRLPLSFGKRILYGLSPKAFYEYERWLSAKRQRRYKPVSLYVTWENTRWNEAQCDFSISSDFGPHGSAHFRFPLWMAVLDWGHEGIVSEENLRLGRPLLADRLLRPLGENFLKKPRKAAVFSMHLKEPRASLISALQAIMPVEGYGRAFDKTVDHHNSSGFSKADVLAGYGYNLCPENSMYPGYYTEKIPEAFACDCLPISWCDSNVEKDFNPDAFVNLAPFAHTGYSAEELSDVIAHKTRAVVEQPLLREKPTLDGIRAFVRQVVNAALK